MDEIEEILKSWEEQGKGYIVPFSYGAISQEIRNLYKGDGGGLEREDIKRILTDWHQGEYLQDDAVDKIIVLASLSIRLEREKIFEEIDIPVRYDHNATCYDCIQRLKSKFSPLLNKGEEEE